MAMKEATLAAVVPTLGASPFLDQALRALADQGIRTVVVAQGETGEIVADLVLREPNPLGFAAAVNLGLAEVRETFVAIVNDDAIVQPLWAQSLLETLTQDGSAAAAQGVNLRLSETEKIDGRGIAWNSWWQAVQLGDGEAANPLPEKREQIFGVSATAAIYRRGTLALLEDRDGFIFDPRLDSYYEDVELAVRLRASGYRSWSVPSALAHHAGSISGKASPRWREVRIRGNRYAVLAALLGRSFWPRLPMLMARDKWDGLCGGPTHFGAVLQGMARGFGLLPTYSHWRPPVISSTELRRFRVG